MLDRWSVWPVMAVVVAAMAGCASYDVRSVGTGGGPPAYTLEGNSLEQLQIGAQHLCPKGYDVQRQWESGQRGIKPRESYLMNKWSRFSEFVNFTDNHAQLAIQCKS